MRLIPGQVLARDLFNHDQVMQPAEFRYLVKLYTSGPIIQKAMKDLLIRMEEIESENLRLKKEIQELRRKENLTGDQHNIAA